MTPGEKFQQLLKDNNLTIHLAKQRIRTIDDGSLIIETPRLEVDWTMQPKEETPVGPVVTNEAPKAETAEPAAPAPTEEGANEPSAA